jgi:hypothetical protein
MTYKVQIEAFAELSSVHVTVYNLTEVSGEKYSAVRKFIFYISLSVKKGELGEM